MLAAHVLKQRSPDAGYHVTGSMHNQAALQARPVHRLRPVLASESGSDNVREEEEAERKRLKAERLALEAERAQLQAEELELKMAKLRLEAAKNQVAEEPPLAAPAPPIAAGASTVEDAATAPSPSPTAVPFKTENTTGKSLALAGPVSNFAKVFGFDEDESRQLSEQQVEVARERVFDVSSFYVTEVEQTFIGTVFRGSLRTNSSDAFELVKSRVAETPALQDYTFMLMEDPVPPNPQSGEQIQPEPVFVALPSKNTVRDPVLPELFITIVSFLVAVLSTLGYALTTYLLSDSTNFIKALEAGDRTPLEVAVPVAFGIGAVQLLHEAGHIAAASKYGLKVSLPTYVPSLQLGTFGCITKLLQWPENRTTLFDFALSGPAVGGGVSLLLYLVGLLFSQSLPLPDVTSTGEAGKIIESISNAMAKGIDSTPMDPASVYVPPASLNPVAPVSFLRSSWLLGSLANLVLPPATTSSVFVSLHPLAVVGFCGVLVNALNLIPAGRLDGGRVSQAVLGSQAANALTSFSILALGLNSLFNGDNAILFFFGLITTIFQRTPENPCLDELSPVDDKRKSLAALAAVIAFLVLIPLPYTPPTSGVGGFM